MNLQRVLPTQLGQIAVVVIGLSACVALGMKIGAGEFEGVIKLAVIAAILTYVLSWTKYTACIALAVSFMDVLIYPGFYIGGQEQTGVLVAIPALAFWWVKRRETTVGSVLEGFGVFRLLIILLLVYLAAHFYVNYQDPIIREGFSVKGAAKHTFRYAVGITVVAYFFSRASGMWVAQRASLVGAQLAMIGLVFNILVRIYFILKTRSLGVELIESAIEIPYINLTDNVFALRTIGPFSATLAACMLTSSAPNRPSATFCKVMLGLAFLGAVLSGGRAAVMFCFVLAGAVFVMRKRGLPVMMMGGVFFVGVVMANIAPDLVVRPLPLILKRSVAKFVVTQDLEEEAAISGSSAFRKRIFLYALDFWKNGDSRLFWTGQSAGSFNETDYALLRGLETEGSDQTALRLAATHNLLTDLLVVFGLIGCILFYSAFFALLYMCWRWYQRCPAHWETKDWALASFLLVGFYIVYASFGGSPFWVGITWIIVYTGLIFRREARLDELPKGASWPMEQDKKSLEDREPARALYQ